jgi:uncharacterized protein YjiS (DUF1127 family)
MQTQFLASDPETLANVAFFHRIGKIVSQYKKRSSSDRQLEELERLALLSPHLLSDIGFRSDAASAPDTKVWRRGEFQVVVARSARTVVASKA